MDVSKDHSQKIVIKPQDLGKHVQLSMGGVVYSLPTVIAPPAIERPAPWGNGPRPTTDFPKSVIPVLQNLNAKNSSGGYVVGDPELLAAKKNLMSYWGMSKLLKPDGSNLKFSMIRDESGETTRALTPNGFFYFSLTTDGDRTLPYVLNIYAQPKMDDAEKAQLVGFFEGDAKKS